MIKSNIHSLHLTLIGFKAIDAKDLKLSKNNGIESKFVNYGKDGKLEKRIHL